MKLAVVGEDLLVVVMSVAAASALAIVVLDPQLL